MSTDHETAASPRSNKSVGTNSQQALGESPVQAMLAATPQGSSEQSMAPNTTAEIESHSAQWSAELESSYAESSTSLEHSTAQSYTVSSEQYDSQTESRYSAQQYVEQSYSQSQGYSAQQYTRQHYSHSQSSYSAQQYTGQPYSQPQNTWQAGAYPQQIARLRQYPQAQEHSPVPRQTRELNLPQAVVIICMAHVLGLLSGSDPYRSLFWISIPTLLYFVHLAFPKSVDVAVRSQGPLTKVKPRAGYLSIAWRTFSIFAFSASYASLFTSSFSPDGMMLFVQFMLVCSAPIVLGSSLYILGFPPINLWRKRPRLSAFFLGIAAALLLLGLSLLATYDLNSYKPLLSTPDSLAILWLLSAASFIFFNVTPTSKPNSWWKSRLPEARVLSAKAYSKTLVALLFLVGLASSLPLHWLFKGI